ncbi:hypothetical protein BE21_32220 [Sorangium cellulosum]|uniref:Uncharacterized protein n=1 Tax=Sorangium cellulosum TaxID=56 RepID=A0A150TQC3_SORCE|nr:hypothetical protein BE21_32220 [Sorangium cellulosum]
MVRSSLSSKLVLPRRRALSVGPAHERENEVDEAPLPLWQPGDPWRPVSRGKSVQDQGVAS